MKKGVRNGDRTVQHPAGVIAKIQHQTTQRRLVLLFQLRDCINQVFCRLGLKLGDPQIAKTRLKHTRSDTLHLDDISRDGDLEGLIKTFTHNSQFNIRPGLTAHDLDRFIECHPLDRGVVQSDDQVTGLYTGALCRRVINRCDDLDEAVFHTHFDTQSAKLAGSADLQLGELFGIQVGRMRVQAGQHAADCILYQFLVVHIDNIVILDASKNVTEGTQFLNWQGCRGTPAFGKYTVAN